MKTDEKAIEPKPCPFCGSNRFNIGYCGQPALSSYSICMDCGARGPEIPATNGSGGSLDWPKTFNAWNKRFNETSGDL